ncbi:MAG: hypothetical protein PHH61_06395 [Candidatus Nanoarchaeia archaeon]|nr:hypothetical protein [Candidatus Nanoarchaeia archaeon]
MNTQKINPKIQKIIDSIPENGAIEVNSENWESQTSKPKKAIGKINGRLEWFEFTDSTDWETVFMWDFKNEPELAEEHFSFEGKLVMPTGKMYDDVFI